LLAGSTETYGNLLQFSFYKASLASNPTLVCTTLQEPGKKELIVFGFFFSFCGQNVTDRILLQGEDSIQMLHYFGSELDDINWKHLQISQTYLSENWPIRVGDLFFFVYLFVSSSQTHFLFSFQK
jgi:hypothetical protein